MYMLKSVHENGTFKGKTRNLPSIFVLQCDKLLPTADVVEQHKQRAHRKRYSLRGKRSRTCGFCDKSFCDNSEFYRHANAFHRQEIEAEGWVDCGLCGILFPDDLVLKNHKLKAHPSKLSFLAAAR